MSKTYPHFGAKSRILRLLENRVRENQGSESHSFSEAARRSPVSKWKPDEGWTSRLCGEPVRANLRDKSSIADLDMSLQFVTAYEHKE
jgi:hypothetical protein